MAVKIKRISKANEELNMASISDIVFLLLIYFMVVTVFQQDIGLRFVLPAPNQDDNEIKIKESNIASIQIAYNNVITLDDVPIRLNAIKRVLEDRLLENPKLVVIMESHPEADYGTMVSVMDEVRLADCRKLALKMMEV